MRCSRLGRPARESVAKVTMELCDKSREAREVKPRKAPSSTFSTALPSRLRLVSLEREVKACEEILLIELRERSRLHRLGGKRSRLGGERAPESRFEDKSRLER